MLTETRLFFAHIVGEDRPVTELLNADYTFVNERLARHYGIEGVKGDEFRRVALAGSPRGGVATQATVLTVTSNPTRTSPVKRGKWILDNLLGEPPPDPPPDVPMLAEDRKAQLSGSLRQRMEQHRADPNCAICHRKMDALGFALENFDAVGAWRTKDGKFAIDPCGTLPDGRSCAVRRSSKRFSPPAGAISSSAASPRNCSPTRWAGAWNDQTGRRSTRSPLRWRPTTIAFHAWCSRSSRAIPSRNGVPRNRKRPNRSRHDQTHRRHADHAADRAAGRRHGDRAAVARGDGAATARAAAAGVPLRTAFLFVPNGMHMPDWRPAAEGPLEKLPPILEPLAAQVAQLTVLTGLALHGGEALGDGPGDHARCVASFLTAAHPRKTDGKDIRNGVSVDQVAAAALGRQTRFASLELGCEPSAQAGNCDSGYSCVYTSNMSWRSPTSPMAKEVNPRAVFDRLFASALPAKMPPRGPAATVRGRASSTSSPKTPASCAAGWGRPTSGSSTSTSTRSARSSAAPTVRRNSPRGESEETEPEFPRPAGVPKAFDEHVRLMMDMLVLAFQTDATRIATFMYTNDGSNRSYPDIGVSAGHHELSHHGNDPAKQAQIGKINRHHAGLLAYFLDQLANTKEGDGTLLDHSMMLYGSGMSDGNRHNHDDLPILLAGRGGGHIRPGRHLRYKEDTPLTNLYLAMLHHMGVAAKSFGDSTAPLEGLS